MSEISEKVLDYEVILPGSKVLASSLPWNPHAKFKGVALKHLVTGQDTQGLYSLHLVRVEAGCEIGVHIHAAQWELHEVVEGYGQCQVGEQLIEYQPGCLNNIPNGQEHRVLAGDQELYILAKFCPPLL